MLLALGAVHCWRNFDGSIRQGCNDVILVRDSELAYLNAKAEMQYIGASDAIVEPFVASVRGPGDQRQRRSRSQVLGTISPTADLAKWLLSGDLSVGS